MESLLDRLGAQQEISAIGSSLERTLRDAITEIMSLKKELVDVTIERDILRMTGPAPRHEKFVEVPGAVHWLFINWPTQKEDAAALKNHMIYYNRWLEDGFTWIQHFPMGEGKMLIEFRRPAGSKGG